MPGALTAFWAGLPPWVQDALKWLGIALAIVFVGKAYGASKKNEGKKEAQTKNKVEEAQTRVEIVERTTQIITEERHQADAALEARDAGHAPASYDQLPDQNRAIAEGRARSRFESRE